VIDESDWQYQKHDEQRIATFRGIIIDWSDDDENADDSIRVNLESDSNVIDENDRRTVRSAKVTLSSDRGIQSRWTAESLGDERRKIWAIPLSTMMWQM
jgi:hypothetical protein